MGSKGSPGPSGRVWIVDDSALERDRSRRALEPQFEVKAFEDGATALEALGHLPPPDLLVLDWQMPVMSGHEICLYLRERLHAAELPILILTGSIETLVEGLGAGANDYVLKPCRPEELRARATTLVALRRTHADLARTEQLLRTEAAFRERFIGILAHDLRQPISTVLMSTQVLAKETSPPVSAAAGRARRAVLRMSRMVDELLDFTRSRVGGGIPISPQQGDLADIVRQAVADRDDRDRIAVETHGNTHGSWDSDRMTQVCANLIGNALEYGTPDRPVHIRVTGALMEISLEVHNEGPAIPAEELSTLFDPFRRGSDCKAPRASSNHAGLGLGLFIVDQIIRAHGGAVNVRSGEDGTTFIARLPRARLPHAA